MRTTYLTVWSKDSLSMSETRVISEGELKAHSTPDKAWVAVQGRVFDVTAFLHSHPGGPEILEEHLGTDATQGCAAAAALSLGHHADAALFLRTTFPQPSLAPASTNTRRRRACCWVPCKWVCLKALPSTARTARPSSARAPRRMLPSASSIPRSPTRFKWGCWAISIRVTALCWLGKAGFADLQTPQSRVGPHSDARGRAVGAAGLLDGALHQGVLVGAHCLLAARCGRHAALLIERVAVVEGAPAVREHGHLWVALS